MNSSARNTVCLPANLFPIITAIACAMALSSSSECLAVPSSGSLSTTRNTPPSPKQASASSHRVPTREDQYDVTPTQKQQPESGDTKDKPSSRSLSELQKLLGDGESLLSAGEVERSISVFRKALKVAPQDLRPARLLSRALAADNRFDEALATLKESLKKNPSNVGLNEDIGNLLLSMGDIHSAKIAFQAALADPAAAAESHFRLAQIAAAQGDNGNLFEEAKRAVQLDPHNSAARLMVAQHLKLSGRLEEAIEQLQNALKADNDSSTIRLQLGLLQLSRGQATAAIENFKIAHRLEPNNPDPLEQLVMSFGERGDWRNSSDYADEWVKLEPDNPAAWFMLGWAEMRNNELSDAAGHLRRAIDLAPQNAPLHNAYGLVLADQRKSAEALAEFNKALQLAPSDLSTQLNIAEVYLNQSHYGEASDWLKQVCQNHPQAAQAWGQAAYAAAKAGLTEQASKARTEALSLRPDETMATLAGALVEQAQGHKSKALEEFELAVKTSPKSPFALTELAQAQLAVGNAKRALALTQEALQLAPSNLSTKACMGRALVALNNPDGAILLLRECVNRNKKSPELTFYLGEALEKKGEVEDASETYNKALALDASYTDALSALSRIALAQKQSTAARQFAERAVKSAPHNEQARLLLVKSLMQKHLYAPAAAECDLLLQLDRSNPEALLLSARLAVMRRNWSVACQRYSTLKTSQETLEPDDTLSFAEALLFLKKPDESTRELDALSEDGLTKSQRTELLRLRKRLSATIRDR